MNPGERAESSHEILSPLGRQILDALRTMQEEHGGRFSNDWDEPTFLEPVVMLLENAEMGTITDGDRTVIAGELRQLLYSNTLEERLAHAYFRLTTARTS